MTPPNLSLIFVMVCFWVTLWIVYRFLIQPVAAVIAERQRRIDDAQHEWSTKNDEHLAAVARVEDDVAAAAKDAARIRAEARQQAIDERQTVLDKARTAADERLTDVLATLDSETDKARAELQTRARELARLLAGRLLGRELTQ